jgi:Leucine-rich repeat (LRR) protein
MVAVVAQMMKWITTTVLGVSCLTSGSVFAQVSAVERQALVDFYHYTGGDDWNVNEGWLGEEGSECDWYGIRCHRWDTSPSHVSSIELTTNGLTGSLPDSLPDLTRLRSLRLNGNSLEGPIPMALTEMAELGGLHLAGNRLSGPVPGELLDLGLGRLDLRHNQLNGYTEATARLGGDLWRVVYLGGNPLASLPPKSWRSAGAISLLELDFAAIDGEIDFENHPWPGLQVLDLSGNSITGLNGIDSGTLANLRRLYLNENHIDDWPVSGDTLPNLTFLNLRGNQLRTPPPAGLSNHPKLQTLGLSDNELAGEMLSELFLMPALAGLSLSLNPLKSLPVDLSGSVSQSSGLVLLDLSYSRMEDYPPEWFAELSLVSLNLAGNQLTGEIEPWLAAMGPSSFSRLNLSNNDFNGPIPEVLKELQFQTNGLDLCWNNFDEPFESEIDALFDDVHHAGHPGDCNQHQTEAIDLTISGSWYHPDRVGEGYAFMYLDNGLLLHYWFGFPSVGSVRSQQKWAFQLVRPQVTAAPFPVSLAPYGGRFGRGLGGGSIKDHDTRSVHMVRLEGNELGVRTDLRPQPLAIITPPRPTVHERLVHSRLTELAGTRCDIQSPFQQYSGAWFNPERSGEGFILEILPDDRGLVYWFTYEPDTSGRPAWMIGVAPLHASLVGVPPPGHPEAWLDAELLQPVGAYSGSFFDQDDIEHVLWGDMRMEFYPDGTAHLSYESHLEDYGSGDYALEHFARPMLADCP